MRFSVQRWIACPPERAFALATHPEAMNRWAKARIEGVETGEGGHVASLGATRLVHLPDTRLAHGIRLEEVVCESRPPHRFVHRVVGGAPLLWHEGVQEFEARLDPRGSGALGTWLRWHVHAVLDVAVPGADALVRRDLEAGLRGSMQALVVAAAAGAPAEPLAPWSPPPEEDEQERIALRRAHREVEAHFRGIRRRRPGDPRTIFAAYYAELLHEVRVLVDAGAITHVAWVHRLAPLALHYYADALEAEDAGRTVEAHWREAFRAAEIACRRRRHDRVRRALAAMIRAHLDEDLPRALATTHTDFYARFGYARFRADFLTLGPAFEKAARRLGDGLRAEELSWAQRLQRRASTRALRTRRARRRLEWIGRARRQAFERGQRLATLLQRGVRA